MHQFFVSLLALALALGSFSAQSSTSLEIITYGDSLTAGLSRTSSDVITCPEGVNKGPARFEPEPEPEVPTEGEDPVVPVVPEELREGCYGDGAINKGGYQPTLATLFSADGFTPLISNYGFSGIRTDQLISRLSGVISTRPNAKYVIIMAGANDAVEGINSSTVLANLSVMVSQVQSRGLIPIISTVTPNIRGIEFERKAKQYSEAIRGYAATNSILLADSRAALGSDWQNNNSGDGLHLSEIGNTILASLFNTTLNLKTSQDVIILVPIYDLLLSDN